MLERLIDRIADRVVEKLNAQKRPLAATYALIGSDANLEASRRFTRDLQALAKIDGRELALLVEHGTRHNDKGR